MPVENLPKNQKEYYHNKVREFEKRTGINMNVKNVSSFYDLNIEDVEYNTPAAKNMLFKHGCYIYHDFLVEEDPCSNGTNWLKYGFAYLNGKTYKYYYEIKQWGQEIVKIDLEHYSTKTWKAAKVENTYLPNPVKNKHIGSNFDDFSKEHNIELKRDMNWAIKMLEQGVIVYREEFPEVVLFPIGNKNNTETKLTVDDLFAEDWTIFRGKSLKEVLDDLDAGKTIRRKSWYPEHGIGIYSRDIELNLQDLKARDWEVVDIVAEVDKNQQDIEDGKY
jgi:hypothetical protein